MRYFRLGELFLFTNFKRYILTITFSNFFLKLRNVTISILNVSLITLGHHPINVCMNNADGNNNAGLLIKTEMIHYWQGNWWKSKENNRNQNQTMIRNHPWMERTEFLYLILKRDSTNTSERVQNLWLSFSLVSFFPSLFFCPRLFLKKLMACLQDKLYCLLTLTQTSQHVHEINSVEVKYNSSL